MSTSDHIAELIEGLDPGAVVTKYVVIAEVIDTDGQRVVWMDTDDDATRWDSYGLLTYALEQERAQQVVDLMDEG